MYNKTKYSETVFKRGHLWDKKVAL